MVLALAGDSTITRSFPSALFPFERFPFSSLLACAFLFGADVDFTARLFAVFFEVATFLEVEVEVDLDFASLLLAVFFEEAAFLGVS